MGERDGEGGKEEGGGKGENGKGWRREGGKVTDGIGGTGQDMEWGGELWKERERKKGREREKRGYSPLTSIPSAATAN